MFIFIFSLLTPIGVVVGLFLTESSLIVDTIFACLSGGTFIYVACSEVIIEEFDQGKLQWLKMIFVMLGGLTVCSVFFVGHSHAGDHGHSHGAGGHAHLLI